jgi:hypothetical protein
MKQMRFLAPTALIAALALAGCETQPSTSVTRFHLNQPIARGQMSVEPMLPADRGSLEYQTYASIVGGELARVGFTEAPGLAASEQIASIAVERGTRESMRRSGFTLGLGGGSYGWNGGAGGGVSIPIGRQRPNELALTRLIVQIKRRSDSSVVWEGRAETSARAGTPEADPVNAVRRLANAMFRDFPGPSGQTITVK